ncbi:MAG TPA: hypothetical protein VGN91_21080 [Bosea sp. (in: a-proteobacteria)]|jgi:hypothetical protein|nr:hypothetical protein [Bosea sp. (in: a-proteobacteria)]
MAQNAAEQPRRETPPSPAVLGSVAWGRLANNSKLGRIVTNCCGPCPKKANMEQMPGVVPYGSARFCETGSAGCKGYQIVGTIHFGSNFLLG